MSLKNSQFSVEAREFKANIRVPSSKSYANRAIILAALCKDEVSIRNLPLSHDVTNLLNVLRVVGLRIVEVDDGICIENSFPECESSSNEIIKVFPGDGGTTTRFLIPFLALGKNTYQIEPEGRMRERPIADLLESLVDLGASVNQCDSWLTLKGPIKESSKRLNADASKTTQHATALALSLAFHNVVVSPVDMKYSKSYWEMTMSLIDCFKKGQRDFVVPVDFSSMSYVLALGADRGEVLVENCTLIDDHQSDSVFIEVLKEMGFSVSLTAKGLHLVSSKEIIKPIDFDCSNCPDLVPTLAFMCSRIDGESKLRNLSVLKYKESDRLLEIQKLLDLYLIDNTYDEQEDFLIIYGKSSRESSRKEIFPPDDHRIVMVSYLFLRAHGGGVLHSTSSVSKSFGNFFEVVTNEE
ncbi:3-phosphoshikimate 1-carboxyvinyltransferase [Halobacteriovorax marinus]|uniref:3-phosphoshikimate 1-carboxyvinyltransferase n=1 Tax=Halobacteriovorax marinus TaxID=97084 RepID=UPI003A9575A0